MVTTKWPGTIRARLLSLSFGSRPTRNQSTSIGAPTSSTASPAALRTVEWRPSQPMVQSARISNSPSGAVPRTPATRPSASIRPVTSARMRSVNAGSFLASPARKSRNSHCGMRAMKA